MDKRDRVIRARRLKGQRFSTADIAKELHVSDRTVNRYLKEMPPPNRVPANPIQQEAFGRCVDGDHWWFEDERFRDQAWTAEPANALSGASLLIIDNRTCWFCGLTATVWP